MSTFVITARVDTVSLKTSDSTWNGSVEIPEFRVTADSKEEAEQLAREIVDPLEMTGVHITAVEEAAGPVAREDAGTLTPYEHYCEAERLLAKVEQEKFNAIDIAKANIHARLACAVIPERGTR